MKLIETFKSPNFYERKNNQQLDYLILHYTAMTSCQEAIEYMCSKKNKVSAHFLVSKKGEIFYLVNQNKIAWHAGKSYWKNIKYLNSRSIECNILSSSAHGSSYVFLHLSNTH